MLQDIRGGIPKKKKKFWNSKNVFSNREINADHFICLPEFVKITPYRDIGLVTYNFQFLSLMCKMTYQAFISTGSNFDEFW